MRNKFLKIIPGVLSALMLLAAITLIVFTVVKKNNPNNETEDKLNINVSFENEKTYIEMTVNSNKEIEFILKYDITNETKEKTLKTIKGDIDSSASYRFGKTDEIYIVSNIKLIYKEKEIYAKDSITVFALIDDLENGNVDGNGNENQNPPLETITLESKKIADTNESLKIGFYYKEDLIYNYNSFIQIDDVLYNLDEFVYYSNGYIVINKKGFDVGNHSLKLSIQKDNMIAEYETTFEVKNEIFITFNSMKITDDYYTGATEYIIKVITDINDVRCSLFKINNKDYEIFSVELDEENSKKIYSINVMINSNEIIDNKVSFTLTEIQHEKGKLSLEEKITYELKKVTLSATLSSENKYYLLNSTKTILVTIDNPLQVYITKLTIDNVELIVDNNDEKIEVYYQEPADGKNDKLTSINYKIYEEELIYLTDETYEHFTKQKIENYTVTTDIINYGSEFIIEMTFDLPLKENEKLKYYGLVNLYEEFTENNVSYEVVDNKVFFNLSNLVFDIGEYTIHFIYITIEDENISYNLNIDGEINIIYSDYVYSLYNFVYDKDEFKIYFNADVLDETLTIKRLAFALYDENMNVVKEEYTTSNVYIETIGEINYYCIMGIPSNAKYIDVNWVDYELNGMEGQVTKLLINEVQLIEEYSLN